MNSRVVRCQGTERLPNASPTTRSAESSGASRMPSARVADAHPQRGRRVQPETLAAELQHLGIDLQHGALGARILVAARYRGNVKPPPPTCSASIAWSPGHATSMASLNERVVVELEVGRVVEVDVAVTQVVEPEDAAARSRKVVLDPMQ